jgi:alpha-galactosidase
VQGGNALVCAPAGQAPTSAPPPAHSSHRVTGLSFRAAVGLQGHAGLEWDLIGCDDAELKSVRAYGALYRELRDLLHSGTVIHPDDVDPALRVCGVVAHDRSQALWTVAAVAQPEESLAERLRLPGLDPDRRYTVRVRNDVGAPRTEWAPRAG